MSTAVARPWYREPLVWLVALFPAAAVAGGLVTAWIAVRSWDGLVVDDYYKRGLEINQTLARDERARALGIAAAIALEPLRVRLNGGPDFVAPPRIDVSFIHGTRAGLDRRLTLARSADGAYTGAAPSLAPGRWEVHVEADDWRVVENLSR